MTKVHKTDDEWRDLLTDEQFRVLRRKGTEIPFSGQYVSHDKEGVYNCAACGAALFKSDAKYESRVPGLIGWPSFSEAVDAGAIELKEDTSAGMVRTEAVCSNCGSHLGHLFEDETSPNGKHYCINSVCLAFKPED